jgi:hypothetical protein
LLDLMSLRVLPLLRHEYRHQLEHDHHQLEYTSGAPRSRLSFG